MGGARNHSGMTPFVVRDVPRGSIFMWSGAIADIPPTWRLCNGKRGTPDLRDLFVQGAGGALIPEASGGAAAHVHDFTAGVHSHTMPVGTDMMGGANFSLSTDNIASAGTTNSTDGRPPFLTLAYIMYDGRLF